MTFANKVVVITGAAGGIGSALARRFLMDGATVCAVDNRVPELQALIAELGASPAMIGFEIDVTREQDCELLAARLSGESSVVDVLVNCAGDIPITRFEDITYAEWRDVCAIGLDATFLMTKAILPLLKESSAGRIINISSGGIFKGVADQCHYVAAKAGVIGFTRSLSQALGAYKITVNAVTPGVTVTPPIRKLFGVQKLNEAVKRRVLTRQENAEDLVGAVVFLASEEAAFLTGQTLNVDGGTNFL